MQLDLRSINEMCLFCELRLKSFVEFPLLILRCRVRSVPVSQLGRRTHVPFTPATAMGRRKRTHNAANLTNWHKGKKVNSNYFSDYGITLKLVIHSIVIFLPHHHHRHLSHSLAPVHLCFSLIPTVIISHPVLSQQRHFFFFCFAKGLIRHVIVVTTLLV